jgi:hypothetical protein
MTCIYNVHTGTYSYILGWTLTVCCIAVYTPLYHIRKQGKSALYLDTVNVHQVRTSTYQYVHCKYWSYWYIEYEYVLVFTVMYWYVPSSYEYTPG